MNATVPCYSTRFKIGENHCGFFVLDRHLQQFPRRPFNRGDWRLSDEPHVASINGASRYYKTRAEAIDVAVWLTDRAAGYPYNMLMAEWPGKTGEAFENVPYERDATYKMGGALWLKTIRRRDFWYECGEGYAHPVGQACVGQCVNRG
jgi:hypothetical protein